MLGFLRYTFVRFIGEVFFSSFLFESRILVSVQMIVIQQLSAYVIQL